MKLYLLSLLLRSRSKDLINYTRLIELTPIKSGSSESITMCRRMAENGFCVVAFEESDFDTINNILFLLILTILFYLVLFDFILILFIFHLLMNNNIFYFY